MTLLLWMCVVALLGIAYAVLYSMLVAASADPKQCGGQVHYDDNVVLPCVLNQGHEGSCNTVREVIFQ